MRHTSHSHRRPKLDGPAANEPFQQTYGSCFCAHAPDELTAEHAALMEGARQQQNASFVRPAKLAQRAADWANKVRAAGHAKAVHVQADHTRARVTR